jgi:hypothetical protein
MVDLEEVPVRVVEPEGRAVADVAIAPAHAGAKFLDRLYPAFQGRGACRAVGDMSNAGGVRGGQLQRGEFIVVPCPEIDRRPR